MEITNLVVCLSLQSFEDFGHLDLGWEPFVRHDRHFGLDESRWE